MRSIVISQSMLFPWVGLLEQVRMADVFVHYDDVQFSKGSFVNRVQIKAPEGPRWLTVPLQGLELGQRIDAVQLVPQAQWRERHLVLLTRCLQGAPYLADALALAESVYAQEHASIGALARASLMALVRYFGLDIGRQFVDAAALVVGGTSSERVLAIVRNLSGTDYVTGHGAARYLDHVGFEAQGIAVRYMDYRRLPYPQFHGAFNPHLSGLDLIAHCGREGARYIVSNTLPWREYLHHESQ